MGAHVFKDGCVCAASVAETANGRRLFSDFLVFLSADFPPVLSVMCMVSEDFSIKIWSLADTMLERTALLCHPVDFKIQPPVRSRRDFCFHRCTKAGSRILVPYSSDFYFFILYQDSLTDLESPK